MTARDFARLLIKLMGLFVMAMILVSLSYSLAHIPFELPHRPLSQILAFNFIPLFLALLIGWALFRSDRRIADAMLFARDRTDTPQPIEFRKVEEILLALLGIYLIAEGLISIIGVLGGAMGSGTTAFLLTNVIPGFAQILIGAFVFLSSRGLVVLRHKFVEFRTKVRNMGATE
ncbi:MAG: hypothetical protein Q8J92_03145 [Parvibaculum sp.]|nr:hypothetical protein [Parvibaculum sp.]